VQVGSSVLEDYQVELVNALGVGDQVDCCDLPSCDAEGKHDPRLSARSPHGSHDPVHERRLGEPGASCEGLGHVSMTGRVGDREGGFVIEDSGTWEKGSQDVAYTLSYEL